MTPAILTVSTLWLISGLLIVAFAALDFDALLRLQYSNTVQTLSAVLSAWFCYRTAVDFPKENPMRTVWTLLGGGMLAWGIGAVLFSSYPLLNDGAETPYPYFSDIGFLALVPLVVAALFILKNALGIVSPLWGKVLAMSLFLLTLIISLFVNWDGLINGDILLLLTSILYVIFDPVLLASTLLVASALYGGMVGKAWWWVLGGLGFYFVGNQFYVYLVFIEEYATGSPIDSLWVFGFGMIALAAMMTHALFRGVRAVA